LRLLDGPEHLLAHFGEGDFAALAQRQAEHLRLLLDPASRGTRCASRLPILGACMR
jgi:hypothetical protein